MDPALSERITWLLVAVFYPAWLAAGLVDYICHRRTLIERTSGATESWLHVLEFATLAVALALAVLWAPTVVVLLIIGTMVLAHTLLAFVDVSYTDGRRKISPLEQHAHGFMLLLPLCAFAVFCAQHWAVAESLPWQFVMKDSSERGAGHAILLGSFLILGGIPVLEELLRTLRDAPAAQPSA